jgi:anti-sigma regulatory factor (Ser/Thr protein kinase)
MEFEPSLTSPRRTRAFVGSMARGWGLGDVGSLAELLVSEVVTNAVEHGTSGGTVQIVALPAGLRVEVTDRSDGLPELKHPANDEPTGRGLAIVDRLSRWWGVERQAGGKTVWFEVDDVDVSNIW